jgi:hypothetical protein
MPWNLPLVAAVVLADDGSISVAPQLRQQLNRDALDTQQQRGAIKPDRDLEPINQPPAPNRSRAAGTGRRASANTNSQRPTPGNSANGYLSARDAARAKYLARTFRHQLSKRLATMSPEERKFARQAIDHPETLSRDDLERARLMGLSPQRASRPASRPSAKPRPNGTKTS